jgi:hypothetical protein
MPLGELPPWLAAAVVLLALVCGRASALPHRRR